MVATTRTAALTGADAQLFAAARLRAARQQPYLAAAIFALVPVPSPGLGTFGVDRWWRVYVDMETANRWGVAATAAVLVHEAHHVLRDHHERAQRAGVDAATHDVWNLAADAAINDDLVSDGLPLPNPVLPRHLRCRRGGFEEAYYRAALDDIPDEPDPQCGSGSGGTRLDVEIDGRPDSPDQGLDDHDAEAVRRAVAHEVLQTGRRGEPVPPGLERWALALVDPQVPWQTLLRATVGSDVRASIRNPEPDWCRPDRRADTCPDVLRPGRRSVRPRIAVVIDTSASMDQRLLDAAVSEIDSLLHRFGVTPVDVVVCDEVAERAQRIRRLADLRLSGGRGTDLGVGILAAAALRPTPRVIVVLTDGYTDWPDSAPPRTPVIAVLIDTPGFEPAPGPTGAGFRVVRIRT